MRVCLRSFVAIFVAVLVLSIYSPNAFAANNAGATISLQQPVTDAKLLIEAMERSADMMDEYKYECDITSKKGGKTIKESGIFYFKKPRSIRVDVTAGPKHGSVAIMRPDGKVKGHLGGFLRIFVGTISPDSQLLTSTTGFSLVRSDYKTLAAELSKYLREGWKADLARTADGDKYVLDMKAPGAKRGKRIIVDEKTFLPVEWENTSAGNVECLCKFKNLVVNPHLPNSLFKI